MDNNNEEEKIGEFFIKLGILKKEEALKKINCSGAMKEYCIWLSKNPLLGDVFFEKIKRLPSLEKIEDQLRSMTKEPLS